MSAPPMLPAISRSQILEEARSWIGTPYRHQSSEKGVGCDCLGLVRGIWRSFYGTEPQAVPPYSPNWAEKGDGELLVNAAHKFFDLVELSAARPGDLLLFRMQAGVPVKHIAVLEDENLIVHAYWGRAVTHSFLAPFWKKRRVFAFSFPNLAEPL